jgi:hypothetical protein
MECPKEVAGHYVGHDGEQHQENRDPKDPTVMHSTPARSVRMIVVMLVIMLSIVHTMQGQPCRPQKVKVSSTLPALASLEKKKGDWRFRARHVS